MSGFSQGTDRALSRAAGFDTHLAKPLPLTDLLDLLEGAQGHGESRGKGAGES